MSDRAEIEQQIEHLVEKNRRLIEELQTERNMRRAETQRARASLRRAQQLIRKAAAAG